MDGVRCRIQNEIAEADPDKYHMLKHMARALKTKDSNKPVLWDSSYDRKQQRLKTLFHAFPDLLAMSDVLQNFHAIIEEKSYAIKRASLSDWLKENLSSEVPELSHAARTIRLRRGYIQNSWKYLRSNGPCEGLNNKIKVIKRLSFGIHSFEILYPFLGFHDPKPP